MTATASLRFASPASLARLVLAPALLGLALAAQAAGNAPTPRPDVAKGEKLYVNGDAARNITACIACHGALGNSTAPINPKLAAQHAGYIYKQLRDYKIQPGATKPARENAVMNGIAAALTSEDMRNIAAYLEAQKLEPSVARNAATAELGQRIYRAGIPSKNVPSCAACHGPTGAGVPTQYPRIAGQFAEYTEAQLVAWRQGVRKNNAQMEAISARMSDAEIKAVSDYIAGLR